MKEFELAIITGFVVGIFFFSLVSFLWLDKILTELKKLNGDKK